MALRFCGLQSRKTGVTWKGMTTTELKELAMKLPDDERLELGQQLVDSALPSLTDEQKKLVRARIEQYENDPSSALSEEEFQASLDAKLSAA